MKRLGKFTGRVYDENEVKGMKECGVCITDEQANDENWIKDRHIKDLIDCIKCGGGCPQSQFGRE